MPAKRKRIPVPGMTKQGVRDLNTIGGRYSKPGQMPEMPPTPPKPGEPEPYSFHPRRG